MNMEILDVLKDIIFGHISRGKFVLLLGKNTLHLAHFSKIYRNIHTMIPHPSLALNAFTLSQCTFTSMSC